jgi:hypothetical protein
MLVRPEAMNKIATPTKPEAPTPKSTEMIYDFRTPTFDKYYRTARKHVRFPRNYNKALNW